MSVRILVGDVFARLRELPADSVHCVVTSPPYWGLRDYGTGRWEGGDPACEHRSPTMREGRDESRAQLAGSAATNSAQLLLAHRTGCGKCGAIKVDRQIGLESTLGEHLAVMVDVFREVRRVLRPDGTLWLNYGSCYATSPNGRSAADTKAAGNDDRTFRDKPFSTIGRAGSALPHVPMSGSGGISPQDSPAPDSACSGPDDGSPVGSVSHRHGTARNGLSASQAQRLGEEKARDSETPGSWPGEPLNDAAGARASTIPSSSENAPGEPSLEDGALAGRSETQTSSADEPLFVDMAGCTNGTAERASGDRNRGMDASARACDCGSCGLCFVYLATSSLMLKAKDLVMVPNLLALALQADGWWVRSEIIWHKPNPMPESIRDRPTTSHEKLWLLAKSERYFYDAEAIREDALARNEHDLTGSGYSAPGQTTQKGNRVKIPGGWDRGEGAHGTIHRGGRTSAEYHEAEIAAGRNKRNVWTIATAAFSEAHFATFPPDLIEPCIKAGCPAGGTVLDPFGGSGTTGLVADRLGRKAILIELNPEYAAMAERRVRGDQPMFADVTIEQPKHAEAAE